MSFGFSVGFEGSQMSVLFMYMARMREVMVPVLLMRMAFRYSVPLMFSVEMERRTIFSWARCSSMFMDSSAFCS